MQPASSLPAYVQVVLDTPDVRGLAEFYRQLLGYVYRPGDEPRADERDLDWLVVRHPSGSPRIAFQYTETLHRSTWPQPDVPQQLHLRSEEHTSELQSHSFISYAVFCLK